MQTKLTKYEKEYIEAYTAGAKEVLNYLIQAEDCDFGTDTPNEVIRKIINIITNEMDKAK